MNNIDKQDLDAIYTNMIHKAFEPVLVIEIAVDMLKQFQKLAHRQAIRSCVQKKEHHVCSLFSKHCQKIRQEFDSFHREPPLRINEPQFSGSALWAQSLCSIIKNESILVCSATDKVTAIAVELESKNLIAALTAFQHNCYNDWLLTLASMDSESIEARLDQVSFEIDYSSILNKYICLYYHRVLTIIELSF